MNTYHAFYNGKEIELQADSSYQAQQKAAGIFKAKKSYQVTVVLMALEDNKEIVHIPDF
jgi:hypothetical protein